MHMKTQRPGHVVRPIVDMKFLKNGKKSLNVKFNKKTKKFNRQNASLHFCPRFQLFLANIGVYEFPLQLDAVNFQPHL